MIQPKTLFLIAGEPSGDFLGARLIHGLQAQIPSHMSLKIMGIGGPQMEHAGNFKSLFPMDELSHMGILEIISHIPHLLKRIRETKEQILTLQPDALVTIDAPEFCLRVAKQVARAAPKIPLIHCVAPSVWAWRPGRAKKIAQFLDHLLALFPFEPPYFEKEELPCTFVGHPLLENSKGNKRRFYEAFPSIDKNLPLLCLLPGSRRGEVSKLLPIFAKTMAQIRKTIPSFNIVIPTVPVVESLVREGLSLFDPPYPLLLCGTQNRFDAFAAADVALAASGTVTLELAFHETPLVVAYQASWITEMILKRMVSVSHVCLINLILNESLIPECLQRDCHPERLAAEMVKLLSVPSVLQKQKEGLKRTVQALRAPVSFSQSAAEIILQTISDQDKELKSK